MRRIGMTDDSLNQTFGVGSDTDDGNGGVSTSSDDSAAQAAMSKNGRSDVSELEMEVGDPLDNDFNGLPVLRDVGHPLVPEIDHGYIKRPVQGSMTDVELACKFIEDDDYAALFQGETGVGKDFLIEYICAKTNRPMVRVNFGQGTTYADLIGDWVPSDDGGFEFKPGILYMAVKHGWVFVADEINAAGPEATMPLHGITETDGSLSVPPTSEVLDPHPEFKFVATMNPPSYPGTKPLNDAFRTRFWVMDVDYLEPEGEKALLFEATHLTDSNDQSVIASRLADLAQKLRQNYKNMDIVTPISHRDTMKVARLTKFMDAESAAKQVLVGMAAPEDKNAISKAIETTKWP
jgi:MoxR-like ATPase